MSPTNGFCSLNLSGPSASLCPVRMRLADAYIRLQHIEVARAEGNDPQYAKTLEDRIIWRELLDLELQEIDKRIETIASTAGR